MKRFLFLITAFCWAGAGAWTHGQSPVLITEFMADNSKTLADANGDFSDWIEIHNRGPVPVNLGGWFLTDSQTQLSKWQLPATNVAPGGFLVVFASGKDRAVGGAPLHTSFGLDADGEYLALVEPDGTTVASEYTFPEQFKDVSYGLSRDFSVEQYFSVATPGTTNATGVYAFVKDTKFSHDRGFYEAPFDLTITTETTNAVIRYTTNGTVPSLTNGIVYAGPIRISRTTVIRAAGFKQGYAPSDVDTQTYLFLDDVIRQSPTGQAPPGWPSSWGANTVDYGIDPDVVNNPKYSGTIKADLKSLPSFSVVMNLPDLFNSSSGIYANPGQDGIAWERRCSVELIYPDGRRGFQINAGIRIRGGFSRSTSNPKHAFRLFFRDDYGASKLRFPLFGDNGTDTFDAIDLRTFQNYSWSFQGDASGVFLRDQFNRDTQLAMGAQSERGDFCHLYINGQYWGLFNTCERPEASYAATYFGGNKEDYDVIKVEAGPYSVNATDGSMQAWTRVYNFAKSPGFALTENYQKIQGNNPDGTRNPAYERLLDIPNLIDYMLLIFYGGNLDAPVSNFLGNTSPNNFYGIYNRLTPDGFKWVAHDSEHTLLPGDANRDRTGPFTAGDTSVVKSNPQWVFQKLTANAEFKMLLADHIHRHFFNGGALTPQACRERFMVRKAEIDRAVVGESARWGDAKRSTPMTRDVEWVNAINSVLNSFFPNRTTTVLNQLKAKGWYPSLAAPAFSQHGGNVSAGFRLSMTAPAGTIYFTLDGSDPRLRGGAVAPGAQRYQGPITINESVTVKSRVLSGATWSALNEAPFTVIQTFTELAITEIMYNPPAEGALDGDEFEFIELKNIGSIQLDLSGVHFTNGLSYRFPNGTKLAPGGFVVLVSNPPAFTNKYPGVRFDGVYSGRLSNNGETLAIVHAVGTGITAVRYGDQAPWPLAADGAGFSLVPVNANLNPDPDAAVNWRASSKLGGSPGKDDPSPNTSPIWVNEVLTHTDPPQLDAIELFNPNATNVAVGGWFLTDNRSVPKKYRIPGGTVLPAGSYVVFTEADFNGNPGIDPSFTLSSHAEEVYLYSADGEAALTGYSDGFSFGAAANGVSFGRHVNSGGDIQYPAQATVTLGALNSGPRLGPVVINEIQYHPAPGDVEFVELKNISSTTVQLYDPQYPTNRWKLSGVDFDFPTGSEIAPGGLCLLVASDPALFRGKFNVPPDVPVFGPFAGVLQDSGELLELLRPDAPDVETNGAVVVPLIVVEAIRYNDRSPWPTNADGAGPSLERLNAAAYGNDPSNWRASPGPASPGFDNSGNRLPRVVAGLDQTYAIAGVPFVTNLMGTAADDGQPSPPGGLSVIWSQVSGPAAVTLANPNQLSTSVSFPGVGIYVLRLTVNDGELQAQDEVTVVLERTPAAVTLVPAGSTWTYLDVGTDQGTAWRAANFDDATWSSGKAQLGYGDGDETTVVGYGPNAGSKYPTTYFRRAFTVTGAAAVKQPTVKLLRDDGAVVYVNGIEVVRSNMPEGAIGFATFSSGVVGGTDESAFYETEIDPGVLVEGRNVLAVELHQANASSSDIGFDLELGGLMLPENQPPNVKAGPDALVQLPALAQLKGSAVDDGLPIPPGRLSVVWSQIGGPGSVTFDNANDLLTTAAFPVAGNYQLRLTANDGQLSTQDDLMVTVTGEPLASWKARFFSATELGDPAVSSDDADPDLDGHTNVQEYLAGTNPRAGTSVLALRPEIVPGMTGPAVKLRFNAVAGRVYRLEARAALLGTAWATLRDISPVESDQEIAITDPITAGANARYYRVVVGLE